jgi:hypothetical protein
MPCIADRQQRICRNGGNVTRIRKLIEAGALDNNLRWRALDECLEVPAPAAQV